MLFTFANKQVDFLVKSDFNSLTCLLIGKLFDYCFIQIVNYIEIRFVFFFLTQKYINFFQEQSADKKNNIKEESEHITWSNALCLYFDIQTVLLNNLKFLYLKDSIIFFGSYYETIARVTRNILIIIFSIILNIFSQKNKKDNRQLEAIVRSEYTRYNSNIQQIFGSNIKI